MKIIKLTNAKPENPLYQYDERMFYPVDEADKKLFMHCTADLIAVTREFLQSYLPVFEIHGVTVEIEDVTHAG